jgi:uncharacterized membrane protein YhdT
MLERLFSMAGMVVLPCWILIAAAPRWKWSQRLATFAAPLLIAALYVWLLASHPTPKGGGFNSLAQVMVLFSSPYAVLAGWVHYLAFDLFTGAWEARDAARLGISRWFVLPCLLLTFLFGPLGLALYLLLKLVLRRSVGAVDEVLA